MTEWWRTRRVERDPAAALERGRAKQLRGDLDGAAADFRAVVAATDRVLADPLRSRGVRSDFGPADLDRAALAALLLGEVLEDQDDPYRAAEAYRRASRARDRRVGAQAMVNLGVLLHNQGDAAGAEHAFQQVARSGDKELAPLARGHLKTLRAKPPAPAGIPPGVAVVTLTDRALGEELVADRGKLEAMLVEWDAPHLVGQRFEGKRTEAGYEIWFRRR